MRYPAEGSPLTHFHTHSHTAHSALPLRIHCTRSLLLTPRTAFNTHQQMHSLMKDLVSAITHSRLLIDILFCTNAHREWMKISLRCSFIISSRASVVPPECFSRTDTESSIQKDNKNDGENTNNTNISSYSTKSNTISASVCRTQPNVSKKRPHLGPHIFFFSLCCTHSGIFSTADEEEAREDAQTW